MNYRQTIGKFGERLAKNYLIKHGYRILNCNLKLSFTEIDMVAKKEKIMIFIEVRTRISKIYGPAEESFTPKKMNNFKKAIELFLEKKDFKDNDFRADLITIDIDKTRGLAKIKHYKDII